MPVPPGRQAFQVQRAIIADTAGQDRLSQGVENSIALTVDCPFQKDDRIARIRVNAQCIRGCIGCEDWEGLQRVARYGARAPVAQGRREAEPRARFPA
jgi:hypothetical protein